MSNMNVQNGGKSGAVNQAELDRLALEDLMRQMQKAQAEGNANKMQELALKMMEQAQSSNPDPKNRDMLDLAKKAMDGDSAALSQLQQRAEALLNEAHRGSDLGIDGSRFMGTAQKVDVQQLQEKKPVADASRSSGVTFDSLLSNEAATARPRGAKAQSAQSTTEAELAEAGIKSRSVEANEIKYDGEIPKRPEPSFDDETMLLSVNELIEKDYTLPTEVNTRNGDAPLSYELSTTAASLQSDISSINDAASSMEADAAKEDSYIKEAENTIASLDKVIAKLKMESDALISNGSIMLAAGIIMLTASIAMKTAGVGLMASVFTYPAGATMTAAGIAYGIVALALIASGTAMIVIGKQKKTEMEAKEKEKEKVVIEKEKAIKRKEMLKKKAAAAKKQAAEVMQKKLEEAQKKAAEAQANEEAAQPAIDTATSKFWQAKDALDQIKAEASNPPTEAQKEAIQTLTVALQDLDKKLGDMFKPIDKGYPLTTTQINTFDAVFDKFIASAEREYAKMGV